MESLDKYVPFIDYVLNIDQEKYVKFIKLRKWIKQKKNYPISDLNKIEQSIITQYKNLLLENNMQIPQNITRIFAPMNIKQFINLCSDEEDEENKNGSSEKSVKKRRSTKSVYSRARTVAVGNDDEDDDLEIVSVDYVDKTNKRTKNNTNKIEMKAELLDIDQASKDILSKIDQLAEDDIKMKKNFNPRNNYTYKESDTFIDATSDDEVIYQRRPTSEKEDLLFKRRTDFENDEVKVESVCNSDDVNLWSKSQIDIVLLGSDNEDEQPSTSNTNPLNEISTSNGVALDSNKSNSTEKKKINSNKAPENVDLLELNSIEKVSVDINQINDFSEKDVGKNKENLQQPLSENTNNTNDTPDLNPAQVSKVLEEISSKNDFELQTLCEALMCINQMSTCTQETNVVENNCDIERHTETPVPAPPPLSNNLPSPSAQVYYPPPIQQQQQQLFTQPHSHPNLNVGNVAGIVPPTRKLNINDPRIRKELHAIKNSPLYKYSILNPNLGETIKTICGNEQVSLPQPEPPQQPQPAQHQTKLHTCSAYANKTNITNDTYRSPITYGEYKRRQKEKKLEMERKREEERLAKAKVEAAAKAEAEAKAEAQNNKEKSELTKNKDEDIRAKLISTLKPCRDQLTTLWNQQKKNKTDQQQQNENNKAPNADETNSDIEKHKKTSTSNVTKKSKKKKKKRNEIESNKRLERVYSELKCTVKGFNQVQDYINSIPQQSNSVLQNDQVSSENKSTPKFIGLKRRSSIHALSAIHKQLDQYSSDNSDTEHVQCSSSENLTQNCVYPKRRTTTEIPKAAKRTKTLRIADDTSSSESSYSNEGNSITTRKVPVIKLHRLTEDFIRKHTRRSNENQKILNPTITLFPKLKKTCERVSNPKETIPKTMKLKKFNNDCQMTERNTAFCILCRSKPIDLTNHYVGRHKTESYVSRLDWAEIEDLTINTPFAKLQPRANSYRFDRYEIECPFCKDKFIDQFTNLYNHYSSHTGEYAFQCAQCHYAKPYKPDIQSHILHSKLCRNSPIQIMYRYPPHAQCIYLHYCIICNFVQLNEANVLKHLREHHAPAKAISQNVQKCILAAMSDAPDIIETQKSKSQSPIPTTSISICNSRSNSNSNRKTFMNPTPTSTVTTLSPPVAVQQIKTPAVTVNAAVIEENVIKFKVDDDDVAVCNEPCLEDEFEEGNEEKYTLENELAELHEGPSITTPQLPMTVIHAFNENHLKESPDTVPAKKNFNATKHLPLIIKEDIKQEENDVSQPLDTFSNTNNPIARNYTVRDLYRSFPKNVNYLGLYKCMIGDCYYSTDNSQEIRKHLAEHYASEMQPSETLQCPYCVLPTGKTISPLELIEHIHSQHGHLNYQCSMCCYRSCDASNVYVHQQVDHSKNLGECKVYKCSSNELMMDSNQKSDFDKEISVNISKIACKFCHKGFYHTAVLLNHLKEEHHLVSAAELKIYSCIFCGLTIEHKNQIRIHVALKHPTERPFIYDHNNEISNTTTNEDYKSSSDIVNISEPAAWIEINTTINATIEETLSQDIKPDIKKLVNVHEETAKVRLQKLTLHTGVTSDKLFRCPIPNCGGFFSIFKTWLRHMKVRHITLECQCPHCQLGTLLPLEQFEQHFEQHRHHTFICFYCETTSPTELLANRHATQSHSDLGIMRFEKIDFNINYSYSIMLQRDLFKDRAIFLIELLIVLEKRLKYLEKSDIEKLKHQWIVRDNIQWLDDYMENLANRKVSRRCVVKHCNFTTLKEENLFKHISTSHTIQGNQFNCSACTYHVKECKSLEEIFDHIKLHNEFIYICAACSQSTPSRSKMSSHIEKQHSARDVPVVQLSRIKDSVYIKICIVFSENQITFSTMKNCFCCSEQNMDGDVFTLHLKRYHKLSLNYYCERCTKFLFVSLTEVKQHFEQFHKLSKYKIRCELAGHNDLSVTSLNEFEVKIIKPDVASEQTSSSSLHIKSEPMEESDSDNIILLEDDDIAIQNSLREKQLNPTQMPKLKCASLSKLIEVSENTTNMTPSPSLCHTTVPSVNPGTYQLPSTSTLPTSTTIVQNVQNASNANISMMNAQSANLNSTAKHSFYKNTMLSSNPSLNMNNTAANNPAYKNMNQLSNVCAPPSNFVNRNAISSLNHFVNNNAMLSNHVLNLSTSANNAPFRRNIISNPPSNYSTVPGITINKNATLSSNRSLNLNNIAATSNSVNNSAMVSSNNFPILNTTTNNLVHNNVVLSQNLPQNQSFQQPIAQNPITVHISSSRGMPNTGYERQTPVLTRVPYLNRINYIAMPPQNNQHFF